MVSLRGEGQVQVELKMRIEPISVGVKEDREGQLTGLVNRELFQELLDAPVSTSLLGSKHVFQMIGELTSVPDGPGEVSRMGGRRGITRVESALTVPPRC